MTNIYAGFDLLRRLGSVAALLFASTGAAASAAVFMPATMSQATVWEASSASTVEADPFFSMERVFDRASTEVSWTRAIMQLTELATESAFPRYLAEVDAALTRYEKSAHRSLDVLALARTLGMAKMTLHDQVESLGSWLAIARVIHPDAGRYAPVPRRFVATTSFSVVRECPPTSEDIAMIFEFDAVAGA